MTKNSVRIALIVLISLVGFCFILCLAVYGVLACSSDCAAFAYELQRSDEPALETRDVSDWQPNPNATYMFNQLVTFTTGSFTAGGVTFSLNITTGSISCSGVATEDIIYKFNSGLNFIATHKYLFVGCPLNGSLNTYRLILGGSHVFDGYTNPADYGSGSIAVAVSSESGYLAIHIRSGVDTSGLVFIPQLFDLTAMGLEDITSYDQFATLFPSLYYSYSPLPGTLINPSYSAGFDDGAAEGYDLGYDAGFANGLLEVTANTFVSDRTTWSSSSSLLPFIDMNGTVVYNNPLWSVGYEDMFVYGSLDPTSYSYSFNYTMGSYNGSFNTVVSSNYYTFGEDPDTHEQYIAVILENDYVQFSLVMFAHRSYLNLDIVDTNGTSFLPLNYSDLYKVTVFRNNDSNTIFQAGVEFADSRLNETSVSYNTGFSRGVNDAQKYSFYTLIDSVIFSPISMIQRALNFNILGMNMRDFFMSLFTIAVVLYLVRLFLGASSGGGE